MSNFWADKKVFITGANGLLGSHMVKSLLAQGVSPYILYYDENPGSVFDEEKMADRSTLIRGDIRDLDLIQKTLSDYRIDTIFHLAAQPIVDHAVDDPLETFEVNIQGTWNILEAAKRHMPIERVIVASSDKAYGHQDTLPYQENIHALKGVFPYEVSKSCADLLCQSYFRTFQVPVCVTRCTNLYGPGDLKMNRIIPHTIRSLYYNEAPVIRDVSESLRDYLFIEDAVAGYLRLAEKMDKEIHGHAFNFSTNVPLSVLEVINIIGHEMGKSIPPRIIETKKFEIHSQYASFEKAKNVLDWKPTVDFQTGIRQTIPWYTKYFDSLGAEAPKSAFADLLQVQ